MLAEHDPNEYNDEPICPFCRLAVGDAWELEMHHDGDHTEVDCDGCGKQFRITMCIETTYATQPWSQLDDLREQLNLSRARERQLRSLAWASNLEGDHDNLAWWGWRALEFRNSETVQLETRVAQLEAANAT